MTRKFIQFETSEASEPLLVEVTVPVPDESGYELAAGGAVRRVQKKFEEAFDGVKPAISSLINSLHDINNPAEIEVKFGLAINSEATAVLASLGSEISLEISLRWKSKSVEG